MSEVTPKSHRLHIGLFGRRNVGKSSLLNAVTRQQVSIVSDVAGTTTDPVEKPMELLPLGPVLFIDTAGIDDIGVLGQLRTQKTRNVFDRTDLGVVITDGQWGQYEIQILNEFQERKIPAVIVFNKTDISKPQAEIVESFTSRDDGDLLFLRFCFRLHLASFPAVFKLAFLYSSLRRAMRNVLIILDM